MSKPRIKASSVILLLGVLLIITAIVMLVITQITQKQAAYASKETVAKLRTMMPEVHDEVTDDRVNVMMPAMEADGVSFCGIIELPAYGAELPIRESWDKRSALSVPCKYSGSVYDGSLIIGGSDKEGQLDFMQQITKGDCVYITDMVGGKYSYTVSVVKKSSDVSTDYLKSIDADLVLFARNTYSLDYTVVGCTFENG